LVVEVLEEQAEGVTMELVEQTPQLEPLLFQQVVAVV
jgi:hypothetical protein